MHSLAVCDTEIQDVGEVISYCAIVCCNIIAQGKSDTYQI